MAKQKLCWPDSLPRAALREDVPLAPYTTMAVGGPADYFYEAGSPAELGEAIRACRSSRCPYMILGGGSNLVFSDKGYRGLIISLRGDFAELEVLGREAAAALLAGMADKLSAELRAALAAQPAGWRVLSVGAGVETKALSRFAAEQSLSGLEFACGIPGTVGGAVFMNAGAYEGTVAGVCLGADYLDRAGAAGRCVGEEQDFSYRMSAYRRERHVVRRAYFLLREGEADAILARMAELDEKRRGTQPLELPSSGSVFKRPVGYFAGKLIMDAGLKGVGIGGAEVSTKHAGFIVNVRQASAEDVRALVALVRDRVERQFGVLLEPEIRVLDEYGNNLFR